MDEYLEIINPPERGHISVALFDFDGTLSLIRRGWQSVMLSFFLEELRDLNTGESGESLSAVVEDFVAELTGKQTIYQMIRLTEEIRIRGGKPLAPLTYKHEYNRRLWAVICDRIAHLENKTVAADEWLLPGSRTLLEKLIEKGIKLYLASGTDEKFVLRESRLLEISQYFDGRIFGAQDRYEEFSKAKLIRRIFKDYGLRGPELLGIGDGYVEIENTKEVGGIAVGVASDEQTCCGVNNWKRSRLIRAGADIIIPEFRRSAELLEFLL